PEPALRTHHMPSLNYGIDLWTAGLCVQITFCRLQRDKRLVVWKPAGWVEYGTAVLCARKSPGHPEPAAGSNRRTDSAPRCSGQCQRCVCCEWVSFPRSATEYGSGRQTGERGVDPCPAVGVGQPVDAQVGRLPGSHVQRLDAATWRPPAP